MHKIDINCDLGESFGAYKIANDDKIIPLISSANIACGLHAGDFNIMHDTVKLAKQNNISIGAHPGFNDLYGFGRRSITTSPVEVYNMILYQLGALNAFCIAQGVKLKHVKPHGALYNTAAKNVDIAGAICEAVKDFDTSLTVYLSCR